MSTGSLVGEAAHHDETGAADAADAPAPAEPRSRRWLRTLVAATGDSRWQAWLAVVIGVLVVLPVLATGVDAFGRPWYAAGDWAMTELRVIDVGTVHTPLVGPYSRFSWNHPGPLLFWLLAGPYRLTGGTSSSLLLAASIVNAASLSGILAFAWRRGKLPLVSVIAVTITLCTHALGPTLLRDPWNATVTVLPFGLLVVAAWSAFEGDRAALLVLAMVGSFLVQSHVAYAPLVVCLVAAAVVGFRRRAPAPRWLAVGAGVLALLWMPVLVGTVTGDGNVLKVVQHFSGGDDSNAEPTGLSDAIGVSAVELGGWAPGIDGMREQVNPEGGGLLPGSTGALAVPVLALGAAAAVAWSRRREASHLISFVGAVALAAGVGLLAVSRISGEVFDYLVRWWWPLAALWWAAIAAVVADTALARIGTRSLRGIALAPLAVLVLAVVAVRIVGGYGLDTAQAGAGARLPVDDWEPSMAVISEAVPSISADGPVLLRNVGPLSGWAGDAVSARLASAGLDVRVDDTGINRYKYGDHRIWHGERDLRVLWVVTGNRIPDFERAGAGRVLARYDPLPPSERAAADEHERRLRDSFRAAGRQDLEQALDEGLSLFDAVDVSGVEADDLYVVEDSRSRGVPVALWLFDDVGVADLPAHGI